MTDEVKLEIEAAADWWDSRLGRGRRASGAADVDLLMAAARSRVGRSAEEVSAFRAALLDTLEKRIAPHWDTPKGASRRTVRVDYDPDPALADAAETAGLALENGELPIKTVMWIDPGVVTVKEGYGAQRVLAWAAPGWERPPCGKHRVEGDHRNYRAFNEVCAKPVYHGDDCGDWVPDTKRCGTCGGTYVDHESMEAYARPDSCPDWYREDT
jgi:hypothetical protein